VSYGAYYIRIAVINLRGRSSNRFNRFEFSGRTTWFRENKVAEYRALGYFLGMRVKTSISLSPQIIDEIDEIAGADKNRSRLIEQAIAEFIARHRRGQREARDLEILNRSANELNREMEDILEYQVEP
jgi:hypothetical protein